LYGAGGVMCVRFVRGGGEWGSQRLERSEELLFENLRRMGGG